MSPQFINKHPPKTFYMRLQILAKISNPAPANKKIPIKLRNIFQEIVSLKLTPYNSFKTP